MRPSRAGYVAVKMGSCRGGAAVQRECFSCDNRGRRSLGAGEGTWRASVLCSCCLAVHFLLLQVGQEHACACDCKCKGRVQGQDWVLLSKSTWRANVLCSYCLAVHFLLLQVGQGHVGACTDKKLTTGSPSPALSVASATKDTTGIGDTVIIIL